MSRCVLLAALLLLAGCAGNEPEAETTTVVQASGALPRIEEPFTVLPCPRRPLTMRQIEGCAQRDVVRTNREVQARARAAYAALSPQGRRALVDAQYAWLRYRERWCDASATEYEGGSLAPTTYYRCLADLNRRHAVDLRVLAFRLQTEG